MGDVRALTTFTAAHRRARLARRHLLVPDRRASGVADVADALVGLHSSDPVTVYLSAAARMSGAGVGAVDRALYEERSVVRHHAMRRTLWVFTPPVAGIAHHAATLGLVGPVRRSLAKLLVENRVTDDPERWLDDAIAATTSVLVERGEATTRELGDAAPALRQPLEFATGTSYGGSIAAHTRVLTLMGLMGIIVRARPLGSWVSGQYRWAVAGDWLEGGFGTDEPDAAAALADRYLRAFGPASFTDVQWWTGWTKRSTTVALDRAGAEPVTCDGDELLVATGDTAPEADPPPWAALLPGLDPTVMGWKQRSWYLPDEYVPALFDRNGNAGPTIWVDGRVVGAWAQRADGAIATRLLESVGREHRRLIDGEVDRVREFVGDTRFTVRFAGPLPRELATDAVQ